MQETFCMGQQSRGIGLVQLVWILAGLLVAVAAGTHLFHSIRGRPSDSALLTKQFC